MVCMFVPLKDHLWDTAKAENKSDVEQFFAEVRVLMSMYYSYLFLFWCLLLILCFICADPKKNPKW